MLEVAANAVTVTFHAPAPSLAPLVTAYYVTQVRGAPVRDLLHPEWGNLRFLVEGEYGWQATDEAGALATAPDAALFGATSCARVVVAHEGRCFGIGLTPLGWAMLVRVDAATLADRVAPAAAVLGEGADALAGAMRRASDDRARSAAADRWLLARLADAPAPRVDVAGLTRLLADPATATVAELAAAAGLQAATLGRACHRHFGFGPKLLLRRQRFLRTLATVLETGGRLSAAIDPHYTDQSHFNRDFRLFMGEAPMRYFGRVHPILDAAARARRAALGASVQGLHVAR